jgi:DNA-binding transcriptional MocR family regulator
MYGWTSSKVVRTGMGALFGYGSRFGYLPLRQHLVQKLAQHGIDAGTGQIVLTHGANQALDIVIRNFVRPGDRVLVDEPGYYMLYGKLKLSGAHRRHCAPGGRAGRGGPGA